VGDWGFSQLITPREKGGHLVARQAEKKRRAEGVFKYQSAQDASQGVNFEAKRLTAPKKPGNDADSLRDKHNESAEEALTVKEGTKH